MSNIVDKLTQRQINMITGSSYYHIKHYGELDNSFDASYYQSRMEDAKITGRQYLLDLIERQRQKEELKLSNIFSSDLNIQTLINLGYSEGQSNLIIDKYSTAKTGTIQQKLDFLNLFTSLTLYVPDEDNDPLGQAQKIIEDCFYSNGQNSHPFKGGLEDYEIFISSLVGVFNSLSDYSNRNKDNVLVGPMLESALRKLKYLINYYQKEYERKAKIRTQEAKKLQSLFSESQFQSFVDTKMGNKWSKLLEAKGNFNVVKAVLRDSASGFLQQSGGKAYESAVANQVRNELVSLFNAQLKSSDITARVVGSNKGLKGKQQKADIKLDITISGQTSVSNSDFSLTFSVKKSSDSTSSIQIHHGGSVFSYAERLAGQGLGLDFLKEGSFQYVFVNEFQKRKTNNSDFVAAFRSVLQNFGFYFLGQEIEDGDGGADFLYVSNRIYAFSSILEKALSAPEIFEIALRFTSRGTEDNAFVKKLNLMKEMSDVESYYSDEFIQRSIEIGKESIYGTAFTIKLKKSALNV